MKLCRRVTASNDLPILAWVNSYRSHMLDDGNLVYFNIWIYEAVSAWSNEQVFSSVFNGRWLW